MESTNYSEQQLLSTLVPKLAPGATYDDIEHIEGHTQVLIADRQGNYWVFYYFPDEKTHFASAYIQRPDEEVGSDDSPDWEFTGNRNFGFYHNFMAFLFDLAKS